MASQVSKLSQCDVCQLRNSLFFVSTSTFGIILKHICSKWCTGCTATPWTILPLGWKILPRSLNFPCPILNLGICVFHGKISIVQEKFVQKSKNQHCSEENARKNCFVKIYPQLNEIWVDSRTALLRELLYNK